MAESYLEAAPPALKVRDFMAGMTDKYFLDQSRLFLLPESIL